MIINKTGKYLTEQESRHIKALLEESEKLSQYDEQDQQQTDLLKAEVANYRKAGLAVPEDRFKEIVSKFDSINEKYKENLEKTQENINQVEQYLSTAEERYYVSFSKATDKKAAIFEDIKEVAKAVTRHDFETAKKQGYTLWKDKPNNSKNFRAFTYSLLRLQLNALARYHLESDTINDEIDAILQGVSRREYPRASTRPQDMTRIELAEVRNLTLADSSYLQRMEIALRNPTYESLILKAERETSRSHRGKKSKVALNQGGVSFFTEDLQGYFSGFMIESDNRDTPRSKLLPDSQIAEKITDLILVELSRQPGVITNIANRGGTFFFNLKDFVDLGAYSSIKTARQALLASRKAILQTSLSYDKIKKGDAVRSGMLGPLFQFEINEKTKEVQVDLNIRYARALQDKKEVAFISNIPMYYFRMKAPAMRLVKEILRTARRNRTEIEKNGGTGVLTYKYIQEFLGLPENPKDIYSKVIEPIENAIKEVMSFEKEYHSGSPEIQITTSVDRTETARKQVETGRMYFTLNGNTLNKIIEFNHRFDKKELPEA